MSIDHIKSLFNSVADDIDILACLDKNEAGDADIFVDHYRGRVIFDRSDDSWYWWKGSFWERDRLDTVFGEVTNYVASRYLQRAAEERKNGSKEEIIKALIKRAFDLRAKNRVERVLFLTSRDPYIVITGDEWDKDPFLLGLNNGVVDLRTGSFRAGLPGDFLRAHAPTDWTGMNTPAPLWEKTLLEIFEQDVLMVGFVKRLLGYCVTGSTVEHILPILYGPNGRNGKSTILETLKEILGNDFSVSVPADTLMDSRRSGDGPQPFLYGLRGKRLAWASESKEGQKINTGLIKQLTGSDTLNVRTLHSKPVEFTPTHKVMLMTNHLPHVASDDQAAWDRVRLIPFLLRFVETPTKPNERPRNKDLQKDLMGEASGILAWLVQGCIEWQAVGLDAPKKVMAATQAYRDDEDSLKLFFDERCVLQPTCEVLATDLYKEYVSWCGTYSEDPMKLQTFSKKIVAKFGQSNHKWNGSWYSGIGLAISVP